MGEVDDRLPPGGEEARMAAAACVGSVAGAGGGSGSSQRVMSRSRWMIEFILPEERVGEGGRQSLPSRTGLLLPGCEDKNEV